HLHHPRRRPVRDRSRFAQPSMRRSLSVWGYETRTLFLYARLRVSPFYGAGFRLSRQPRTLQTHGLRSQVYVPILRYLFRTKCREGIQEIDFTLDDVRAAAEELGVIVRNPADMIYRMRSGTVLPAEILAKGFYILRATGRGQYKLEQAATTIIELPLTEPQTALDLTPLPVRRLLPEALVEIDEQGLLTIVSYCRLLDHFTGLTVFRLRSHVRKSVASIGQAELDEVDVGVALRDDELPVIFPIEAKAAPDAISRVQISAMIAFSDVYFPEHEIRPLAVKVDQSSLIHILEFNATPQPAELKIVHAATYRLELSEQQRALILSTAQRRL
ncbi:MAG: hypothetical protein ACRD2L_14260, partial [Terriglobia bacterium]